MKKKIPGFFRPVIVLLLAIFSLTASVSAKDEWLRVRSKNFLLVGNASEKDMRKVGTRLEQFRETFRQLFANTNFTAAIPTNVVVFKNDSAYKPFKPKRADGKLDTFVAGFFQPGEDVNYITLSADGEDAEMYGTIFHEYVHFIINTNFGKSEVPPWFNEGLAEYYQTFAIEDDQKVKLGLPQQGHLYLLQQTKLIPLDQLFNVSNYQLLQTGNHSRSIFYAESWALIHYLIQGGKGEALGKFLALLLKDSPPEKAFQDAFQMSYADMEGALRKYVQQSSYKYVMITFKNKLTFDSEMQASPLDEAESDAYLGDLLYHTNRTDDAEPLLLTALKLKPDLSMANTSLGMVKVRQRKFDEAKPILEKAIAEDQTNHIALYNYAYLLSRDGRNEFGYVQSFPAEAAAKIRDALKRAIALKPDFTESYELLAFVNLVNNEQLDESIALLKKALQYNPGNQRYAMRIAEILVRQEKFTDASALVNKLATTSDEAEIKSRAEDLGNQIRQMQQFKAEQEAERKRYESAVATSSGPPRLGRRTGGTSMTDEELTKEADLERLRSINKALRRPESSEKRVIGYVQKIDCKGGIILAVKTDAETFALASKDFDSVSLNAFVPMTGDSTVGCDADISAIRAVITYKEREGKSNIRGDVAAIEFVPKDFRLMGEDELNKSIAIEPSNDRLEGAAAAAITRAIKQALRQPQAGETREFGYVEKIECTSKGSFFNMRTASRTFKLFNSSPAAMQIRLFTRELEGMEFGCAMKSIEIPAVFIYKENADAKSKSDGEIVSLEFVPRSFKLD
jgi:tetratricopeptide (TPR) repeat protein